ncbi:hypothetical protein FTO70_03790 [Methanosarcina sp. KYL-1]|uniref:hypothetical protein n=1 Tax=Methanosarcina sp. KYL-1 TaxID=2602068 RepID=UPI00210174C9|nr:hypothetical protein [Methanosarcina sp. KYL-1]MCQ1534825.1 hypothetical protein [Methanosarcina sp. KYL-1]
MREIIGCTAEGRFAYCIDCKYQDSEEGCREYIRMFKAQLEFAVNQPGNRRKIRLIQVPGVKA